MRTRQHQAGAGLVEATIVLPILLFMVLGVIQAGLVFHAKSNINYATFEAARAGTVNNASIASITAKFEAALLPYYGGGRTQAELEATGKKVSKDLTSAAAVRIEILSPTQESFQDYASPKAKAALKADDLVIPNAGLDELTCPRDVPGCNNDPKTNKSGQTLADANLLKLRITYGIPAEKQMPMVGRFYTWALDKTGSVATDAFSTALVKAGRIPVVSNTVMRLQSDAIRNTAMASIPGPGNDGKPEDPGVPPTLPIPTCPWWDPACQSCPDGAESPKCKPESCGGA